MFKLIFLLIILLEFIWKIVLLKLNINFSNKQNDIPDIFKDRISINDLQKSKMYLNDKTKLEFISTSIDIVITLLFIYFGFPLLEKTSTIISNSYILQGLIFFGIFGLIKLLIDLPFNYYSTFVIEEKYGFNTTDKKTFFIDIIKQIIIVAIISVPIISLILWVLNNDNQWWWKISIGFILFQLLLTWIYPIFIAPIFNKFSELKDEELNKSILSLLKQANLNIENIFVMDASKRTKKQNAYLAGFGKSKRLVLYDTILSYDKDEILAIIGHEIGHSVKKHITKIFIIISIIYTFVFYLTNNVYNFIQNNHIFDIKMPYTIFVYSFIFTSAVLFFLTPVVNYFQRKFEFEADNYSANLLKTPYPLINSLKRLIKENLSNISPHPLYKVWYYNHPAPEERIKNLLKHKK